MSTLPAVTMQDLELEQAELLPSRETLCSHYRHAEQRQQLRAAQRQPDSERHQRLRQRRRTERRRQQRPRPLTPCPAGTECRPAVPSEWGGREGRPRPLGRPSRLPAGSCRAGRSQPFPTPLGEHAREEQTHDRGRRAREHRAHGTDPAPGRYARTGQGAPAGRRGRAARRVPGLRLQPAAVARAAGRRPGHPDVAAAVPGDLPHRRLPRPGRHRGAGQRGSRPVADRRPGPPPHHVEAAPARHRRRRGRPGRPAEGRSAARAQGAGHAAARTCGERRRRAPPAAVPGALGRCGSGQRPGRGLLAVRRPWAGRRPSAGAARPGGPADRARSHPGIRRFPRVRARGRLPLWRRAARRDRRRHLPGLALVLHQRHRLLPAQPRRPAADRPRRPVLQPDLHTGLGRHLRGHLGRDPAPGHRHHAPGDGGAAAPVRPLRRLLHPQRPRRRAGPVRPRRPHPAERGIQGARRPARHRPPAPGPDRGDRLGAVRHPAAHAQHGVPGAAPARDQPGAVARPRAGRLTWPPPRPRATTTRWPRSPRSASPCWPCRWPGRSTS